MISLPFWLPNSRFVVQRTDSRFGAGTLHHLTSAPIVIPVLERLFRAAERRPFSATLALATPVWVSLVRMLQGFHGSIVQLSGNQLLMTMYRGIQGQLLGAWVRRGLDTWRDRVAAESVDHDEMLAALRSLDAARYAAAARRHVDTSLRNALNDLRIAEHKRDPAGAGEVTPPPS